MAIFHIYKFRSFTFDLIFGHKKIAQPVLLKKYTSNQNGKSISYVMFGGGHVGPDEGFGDVWDTPASVVHERGLEMLS